MTAAAETQLPVLAPEDFTAFFQEVHGVSPFPWQTRLLERLARDDGTWPELLDLPTGSGKTAAIDIAVFHLALEAGRGPARRAPVRIAFVVDRRLVVDDAHGRAKRLAEAMAADQPGPITASVAARLRHLAGGGLPLLARRLRGGLPREDDWARTPAQPTVLCSTVDQIGSRLLFRGYGLSDSAKPIQAGLIGADCLILLDEAHLAEPFRQTLAAVERYRSEAWRRSLEAVSPWGFVQLSATPGENPAEPSFGLDDADYADETLARRWSAPKPARLVGPAKAKAGSDAVGEEEGGPEAEDADEADLGPRIAAIVGEVRRTLDTLRRRGLDAPAIGVVVNRVARARQVFERIRRELPEADPPTLLIGPARPADRDALVDRALAPIRTGAARTLPRPLIVVATQCLEAGVDIDLDGLVTEAAPIDALRQRFGRLDRAGRGTPTEAAVVAAKADLAPRREDPVYGKTIAAGWTYLTAHASPPAAKGAAPVLDFGLAAFAALTASDPVPLEALSAKPDAPALMPAHLDELSWTSPVPAQGPEVGLFLHGAGREPASVTVIWRGDISWTRSGEPEATRRLLQLVPPRAAEAIELPLWAVRNWLAQCGSAFGRLADTAESSPDEDDRSGGQAPPRQVFRWAGDDERSAWISPNAIQPGDTIVAPAGYGGADAFGWNPRQRGPIDAEDERPVADVAMSAAQPFEGRRYVVRIAPGLLGGASTAAASDGPDDGQTSRRDELLVEQAREAALADTLAATGARRWREIREALRGIDLPAPLAQAIDRLDEAKGGRIETYVDLYGAGRPRGIVFVAPLGLRKGETKEGAHPSTTEDDMAGSMPGFALPLATHCRDVEDKAKAFARLASLSAARATDLTTAAALHDLGKADPRFQTLLAFGDPLGGGADPKHLLAKSARRAPLGHGERVGLAPRWRHEALSVRLAPLHPRFGDARDPELVLWLIGTHHGHGRPFFPHQDPHDGQARTGLALPDGAIDLPAGPGPQSLAFDFGGFDWAGLYERLKARYGVWELARFEAILRLADHRASEYAAERALREEGMADDRAA